MTSYFSVLFLAAFLPAVVAIYAIVPRRFRWIVLLLASYLFFWSISGKLIVFLLASTVLVYGVGRGLTALAKSRDEAIAQTPEEKRPIRARFEKKMRLVMGAGVVANIGLLVATKYLTFFGSAASSLLDLLGVNITLVPPSLGVPIGISFYTLMAASYLIEVYRGGVHAERNLGHMALYLSFFPQIMEGPISRYGQTAKQLIAGDPVTRANLYAGSMRILFGLAKKIVVADRLNAFVKPVFENYGSYDGGIIALAAVLYTLQLYCDFSGTMDVALGIGTIFNVKLPENFRQPFFSRTASEFWQRWHITLGTWLKDYVYYPISLSKPMKRLTTKARKRFGNRYGPLLASSVALLCVWIGNGLWHGAGSQYLFFGMYYFVLILGGGLIEPVVQRLATRFAIDRNAWPYRMGQIARTWIVIFVGELFFRAHGLHAGVEMFSRIVTSFSVESLVNGTALSVGMDLHDFSLVAVCVVVLFVVGLLREREVDLATLIGERSVVLKWAAVTSILLVIIIFGAYGPGYVPVDPMYAKF